MKTEGTRLVDTVSVKVRLVDTYSEGRGGFALIALVFEPADFRAAFVRFVDK